MVRIPLSITDDEAVQIVRSWLDVFAAEDYEQVFDKLGYAMAYGEGADGIRRDIKKYRSSKLYPGISNFYVTDWRAALSGNPEPLALVRRYEYMENLPIAMTIEVDLPLNGQWSDLKASFVVMVKNASDTEGVLCLEDICYVPQEDDA